MKKVLCRNDVELMWGKVIVFIAMIHDGLGRRKKREEGGDPPAGVVDP